MWFWWHFPGDSWCWAAVHMPLVCLLWKKCLFKIFAHLKNGSLFFWYWVVWVLYICILDISHLLHIQFASNLLFRRLLFHLVDGFLLCAKKKSFLVAVIWFVYFCFCCLCLKRLVQQKLLSLMSVYCLWLLSEVLWLQVLYSTILNLFFVYGLDSGSISFF